MAKLPKTELLISFLNNLFEANKKFRDNNKDEFFQQFQEEQSPVATIVKCSDSRVQMDSFDENPHNRLFTIRNIGNQITNSQGSVDFGIRILKTPLLLIVGHSNCGAVKAAITNTQTNISAIDKDLSTIKLKSKNLKEAIIENINHQVSRALLKYEDLIDKGSLVVIGAVYDFKNDFNCGKGSVVLINVNGISNSNIIKEEYSPLVKKLLCFCNDDFV